MLHRWAGVSFVGALSFAVVAGCSSSSPPSPSSEEPVATTSQAVQDGTEDNAKHPYAVGICVGGQKGRCNGVCSGTLILPNVVVTARHCVQQTNEQINCATDTFGASEGVQWITTSPLLFQSTTGWHAVKKVYVPTETKVCGNDIALIVLNDLVPASEATPVTPGVQYNMGDLDRYQHSYTAIGYGKVSTAEPSQQCYQTGLPASSYASCPGLRRYRDDIPIECIPKDPYIDCPDTGGQVTDKDFIAGNGTCQGDSGSGAFETSTLASGKPVTLGVLSRGGADQTDPTKCGLAIYTRLDAWRDFVVQTAETASASWTLYPKPVPDWTVYVPPAADAGADSGKPPAPSNLGLGDACTTDKQCTSGICADTGAGFVCTTACDETTACTAGYTCVGGYCGVDAAPAAPPPATVTKTTSGCSTSPSGAPGGTRAAAGLAAVAALVLTARRGRRRAA
ncbi:MAG: hypothetical protein JWP97_3290 [Labilithrix sp.]|nr:hypothetical protein [Labilithrix sp.]